MKNSFISSKKKMLKMSAVTSARANTKRITPMRDRPQQQSAEEEEDEEEKGELLPPGDAEEEEEGDDDGDGTDAVAPVVCCADAALKQQQHPHNHAGRADATFFLNGMSCSTEGMTMR